MFCGCELSFGEPPNTRTCEVCLGLPGALPVANAEAIHYGLMIGLALGCELAPQSIFHRKNYFYPDLPKGYQISQYDEPLCRGGRLGDVRIHRVHLEEDAAKLVHAGSSGRIHGSATQHRRLQPRRHPARGDRHRARPARGRGVRRVAAAPAHDAAPARRQRREHGRGLAALRRERVDPPGRPARARDEDRAQEHELLPLPREGDPGGDRAPGGAAAGGRGGRAGDAALRPAHRDADAAALQGGGARLPLLPRARPRPGHDHAGDARPRPRGAARAPGRARGALRARPRPDRRQREAAGLARGARRLLRDRAARRRKPPARAPAARQLGQRARRAHRRRGPGRVAGGAGGARDARRHWSPSARSPRTPPSRSSTRSSPRAATRSRSSSARASARSAAATRSSRSSSRRSTPTRTSSRSSARAT